MRNIAVRIKYDGTNYHGWQIQKNEVTVAETVEKAIFKAFGENTRVIGCGRTDAGVHALNYCANFKMDCTIPEEKIPLAVNTHLPPDIAFVQAIEVEESFNSISNCKKKEYIYKILNSNIKDPFLKDRVCFYPQKLDVELIERACQAFIGTHDFKAVRSLGTETKTTVRTVFDCGCKKEGDIITINVCADGFLYNMCRAMVGTMVYASYGKIVPEEIPRLLEIGDRRLTGPTMPPQGLYLNRVWYEGKAGELFINL